MKKIIILFGFALCTTQLTAQTTYYKKVLIQNSDGTYREALIEQTQPSVDFGSEPQIYSGTQNNNSNLNYQQQISIQRAEQQTYRLRRRAANAEFRVRLINTVPGFNGGYYFGGYNNYPRRYTPLVPPAGYIRGQIIGDYDYNVGRWRGARGVW